jgi:hypothetical protein
LLYLQVDVHPSRFLWVSTPLMALMEAVVTGCFRATTTRVSSS